VEGRGGGTRGRGRTSEVGNVSGCVRKGGAGEEVKLWGGAMQVSGQDRTPESVAKRRRKEKEKQKDDGGGGNERWEMGDGGKLGMGEVCERRWPALIML